MIEIAITREAYEAIKATLPQDRALDTLRRSTTGKVFIWLDRNNLNRLRALRGRGEELSDVIVRLAKAETAAAEGAE